MTFLNTTHLGPLVLHLLTELPELVFTHFASSDHDHAVFGLLSGVILIPAIDRRQVDYFIGHFLNNLLDLHWVFNDFVG